MKGKETEDLRLDPSKVICPKFDEKSIAMFPVADPEDMGVRVVDNCAEEHIKNYEISAIPACAIRVEMIYYFC